MMIEESIRRFILTSIDSVPHLEAVLLFRYDANAEWNVKAMSQRLFISEKRAGDILADLCDVGFIILKRENPSIYQYHPRSAGLQTMVDRLPNVYADNMIEVHNLIHSKIHKQAQQFGDAFKWKNKEE